MLADLERRTIRDFIDQPVPHNIAVSLQAAGIAVRRERRRYGSGGGDTFLVPPSLVAFIHARNDASPDSD